ncbi:MAG TPA: LPS assembly protein LptD [Rhizomicrobium sp.]|jgi:LPS-assembly protein|nr:LPS assembly protein LptD [Rhizomicrobium sp.]
MNRRRPALLKLLLLGAALSPWLAQAAAQTATQRARPAVKSAPSGDRQILLQADQVVYDGDAQTVSAEGHVEIVDQGRILDADKVTYNQKTDQVTADGHVSITDTAGNVAFSDHVVLTDHMRDGALNGFGALIGKNGRLAAASAQRVGGTMIIAHQTVYSPCKICNQPGQKTPLWQVKSERVVYDQVKHRIHFTDATLDLFGVPILYTPVLSEPDPTVKYASGFLAPDLGNSTKIGYFARIPYYFAISPTNDLTVAPQFSTLGGELVEGEYRARWDNSGMWLQGSLAYNPNGGLGGTPGSQTYDHLFGSGRFALDNGWANNNGWRAGFDTELTNNAAYMRFYDISYLDRLVNDLFIEDVNGRSRFALTGYYFQGLRATDVPSMIPYVLPQLNYTFIPTGKVAGGRFRLDVSSVSLTRSSGPDSQRLTTELNWRLPMVFGGGQLWTLIADARGDLFHVDNNNPIDFPDVPDKSRYVSRGVPYVALDWRWPFVNQTSSGNSYVLEPLAQVIAQPYGGNPKGLPNEDSDAFEFDANNLFSVDQLPGYDLIESGPRANVGFIADALFKGGEIQGLVGQTYRLKPDPIFAALTGENGTASDVISRISLKFPHVDFTDQLDFDRGNGSVRRHEVYVTGTYGRSSLQIAYVQLPAEALTLGLPSREQVNAQADINFYQNWQAFAAIERDLLAGQMLDTEYGLGYEDECLAISIAYRRKYTFDAIQGVPPSTSVILRFSLKTGDQPVQPFSLFPQNVFATSHP